MAKSTVVYSFAFVGLVALAFILFPGARPQENTNTTQPGLTVLWRSGMADSRRM